MTRHLPDTSGRQASMLDVARVAGVSAQTVSRVSNGSTNVREDTRQRVIEAMRELGYRPNGAARALKRGRFGSIGVIAFTLDNYGNLHTLEAIVDAAAAHDHSVTVIQATDRTMGSVSGAYDRLAEAAVDAVVLIVESHLTDTESIRLPPGLPVVVVDAGASSAYPTVDTDQASGARQAVEHLVDLGHRSIAHVRGPRGSFSSDARAEAFTAALTAHGLAPAVISEGDWTVASGHAAAADILAHGATAVFAANDEMALGFTRALHERGIRVPEDVSVVGFDNSTAAESAWPPLTSIDQDFASVGEECVRLLLSALDGAEPARQTIVPTRLIIRGSTTASPRASS